MDIDIEKNFLREKFKNVRKSFNDKETLDSLIFKSVVNHIDFSEYKSVMVYVSFGIEVDTLNLIEYLKDKNILTYSPKCYVRGRSMRFFNVNDKDSLVKGAYGILEPLDVPSNELVDFSKSLCIVPALAFDKLGYRLGWGGGYYDRFLSCHRDIFKLGITYSSCLCDALPKGQFDIPMDMVLTEKNIIWRQ